MNPLTLIRDLFAAICGAAIALALTLIYYEGVPIGPLQYIPGIRYLVPEGKIERVKREAREQCVSQFELDSTRAELAETKRQLEAGRKALDGYAELLQEAQAREIAVDAELDRKVSEYEQRLNETGRRCNLDQSDIDWLRN